MGLRKKKIKSAPDNKSGIVLTNEIRISPYTCEILPGKMICLQIVFIIIAVMSVMWSLINSMGFNCNAIILNSFIIIYTLVAYGMCYTFKKYRKTIPLYAFIAVSLGLCAINLGNIKRSFLYAIDAFVTGYNEYYGTSYEVGEGNKIGSNLTWCSLFIAMFLIIVITYILCCYMSKLLYFIVTIPFISLPFLVGFTPSGISFYCYMISGFAIWGAGVIRSNYCVKDVTNKTRNNIKQKNFKDIAAIKIGFTAAAIAGALMCVCMIFLPKNKIEQKGVIQSFRSSVEDKLDRFSIAVSLTSAGEFGEGGMNLGFLRKFSKPQAGGISRGDLNNNAGIEFKNSTRLKVTTCKSKNTLYIKGYVGLKYDEGWKPMSKFKYNEKEWSVEGNMLKYMETQGPLLNYNVMKIENVGDSETDTFVPYSGYDDIKVNYRGDIELNDDSKFREFYEVNSSILSNDLQSVIDRTRYDENEAQQAREAAEFYLDVPEVLKDSVIDIKKDLSTQIDYSMNVSQQFDVCSEDKVMNILDIADRISEYLDNYYTYTLKPDVPPASEDIINYFLTKGKEGYCMHFASAATAIFRSYGIPARYVEGYIVTGTDFKYARHSEQKLEKSSEYDIDKLESTDLYEMDIMDTNAHAWVEIFIDSIGWVPVEVTGATVNGERVTDNIEHAYQSMTAMPQATLKPSAVAATPATTKPSEQTGKPSITNKPDSVSQSTESKVEKKTISKELIWTIVIILIIAAVVGGTYMLMRYRKKVICKKHSAGVASKNDTIKYVADIISAMMKEKKLVYTNDMAYYEYAEKISKSYTFVDEKDAKTCIELILKECYSKNGITSEEYEAICNFYNYFISKALCELSKSRRWYYENIKCVTKL